MNNRIMRRAGGAAAVACLAAAVAAVPATAHAAVASPAARTTVARTAAAQTTTPSELENVATGLCLADSGQNDGVIGTGVDVEPCAATPKEEWLVNLYFAPVDTITNVYTGTCLGVVDAQQPAPTLASCGDSLYDTGWVYQPDGTGAYSYENIEGGGCLTAGTDGVTFGSCSSDDAAWTIVPVS